MSVQSFLKIPDRSDYSAKNFFLPNPSQEILEGAPNVQAGAKSDLSRIVDSNDTKRPCEGTSSLSQAMFTWRDAWQCVRNMQACLRWEVAGLLLPNMEPRTRGQFLGERFWWGKGNASKAGRCWKGSETTVVGNPQLPDSPLSMSLKVRELEWLTCIYHHWPKASKFCQRRCIRKRNKKQHIITAGA